MEGDYLELSQFPYNPHPFPYNSHQSPLGTTGLNFFSLFLRLSHPFLAKNNAGKEFFNFLIFFIYFFRNFLARVEYERNSGLNFFSLFVRLSHPVLAKNNAGKGFFNFLYFLAFFFPNFLARVENERTSGIIFFFSLSSPLPTLFG